MQNREAARYARWSAGVAIAIVFVVAAVFVRGRLAERAARKNLPLPVPATVAQQSAGFTYSKVVGNRTLFTIRASQATEYTDKNRSLLENVSITIYGLEGKRNDSVRAGECSYEPATGSIRCQGAVQIDLRNAAEKAPANAAAGGMHIETSDISLDGDSGNVSTRNAVTLRFPGGEGKGTGVVYDPKTEDVKLEHNVQLSLKPSGNPQAIPVSLSGSALEFWRRKGTLRLFGPVHAKQGRRVLTAGTLEVELDSRMQPRRAIASGQIAMAAKNARGAASLAARRMEVVFGTSGAIEKIIADGNIRGEERSPGGADRISAERVELMMAAQDRSSAPHEMLATGNVRAEMQQGRATRNLRTASLRLKFAPEVAWRGARVESAETLAPGQIVAIQPGESNTVQGGKLKVVFDARNQLTELDGSSGVKVVHQAGTDAPQTSTAQTLTAIFGANGAWETADENGGVKFEQAGRTGQAERAQISRAANEITLTGAASVADAASRLSANQIAINQKTGDVRGSGNVVTSYFGGASRAGDSSAGAANISADQMSGSNSTGHAVFTGHARFWQGGDVLQAQSIEFWRDQKRAEALGNVVGAFPEPPGNAAKKGSKTNVPAVWQVRAPKVDYVGDSGRVELTGGVKAQSDDGSISSHTLELFLSEKDGQRQELERAVAQGGVRIEQNGRVGTAERGEYFAHEGKFVLSGGQPALSDGSGNRTTGRELTFFLASDTILVDSRNGSRTITKHRVEK